MPPPAKTLRRQKQSELRRPASWAAVSSRAWQIAISAGLYVAVFLIFWRARQCGFVNYDDDLYVTDNPHVRGGLSWAGVRWAFSNVEVFNWHPLTWLSLMLDFQCFGLNAGMFHLVNVGFHAANSILLFWSLQKMTGATWRSAFVAAAFAVHPLHVESVAWIAERKDVLSAFFGILGLLAYAIYVEKLKSAGRGRKLWYAATLIFFAFSLMSKPMLVTFPFLLLLLDFWPLGRMTTLNPQLTSSRQQFRRSVFEKVPFLVLSAGISVVTLFAQTRGAAAASLANLPFDARVANAVVACVRYLGKIFWPTKLVVFYPYANTWSWSAIVGAAMLLTIISVVVILFARKRAYLPVGWFWFLGTLVPVIGLVQVGKQSMADRYSYIPSIGIFILLAWGGVEFFRRWKIGRWFLQFTGVSVLGIWCVLASRQVDVWQDTVTLFGHAMDSGVESGVAQNQLGYYYLENHQAQTGLEHVSRALELDPNLEDAHLNFAWGLLQLGRYDEAIDECQRLLRQWQNPRAYVNLGSALAALGKTGEAIAEYRKGLELKPDLAEAHYNLGNALFKIGKADEAAAEFQLAIQFKPYMAEAHFNLASLLLVQGKQTQAIAEFSESLRLEPGLEPAKKQLRALGVSVP